MGAKTGNATRRGCKNSLTNKSKGGIKRIKRRKCDHVVYQAHHPNKEKWPDYTIRLRRNHHVFLWRQVQRLQQTQQSYDDILNLWNAIRDELDKRSEKLQGENNRGENPT
jgi:hypothetical protein